MRIGIREAEAAGSEEDVLLILNAMFRLVTLIHFAQLHFYVCKIVGAPLSKFAAYPGKSRGNNYGPLFQRPNVRRDRWGSGDRALIKV